MDWACPVCNTLQRVFIKARSIVTTCTHCDTTFYRGVVLYKAPRGPRLIPRDTLMIADMFVGRRLVNRVYCDHCSNEVIRDVKARMVEENPAKSPDIPELD